MKFSEFENATASDLRREVVERFDLYDTTRPGRIELLWEAQFFMAEIDRRESAWIAKRDLILELIIIVLIVGELVFGINGLARERETDGHDGDADGSFGTTTKERERHSRDAGSLAGDDRRHERRGADAVASRVTRGPRRVV